MAALGTLAREAKAAPTAIVVTVRDEMCGTCVRKIESKLGPIPGIATVRCDPASKTVTVVPKPRTDLDLSLLWAAFEEAGKNPARLCSPGETFTSKPKGH